MTHSPSRLGPRAGWFWIGLGGRKLEDDQLETAHLAPAEGARLLKFQLIETLHDGNVLKVRVAEHAPTEGLFLWSPARAPSLLDKSSDAPRSTARPGTRTAVLGASRGEGRPVR